MKRRHLLSSILAGGALYILPSSWVVARQTQYHHDVSVPEKALKPLEHGVDWWRDKLPDAAWQILFQAETEPAGSSPLNGEDRSGTFVCAACYLPLFSSDTKYESGTGWPSFWAAHEKHMGTKTDYKAFWPRTEYHCIRCGGHQGHVFDDGPDPTGKRWCNNGLALQFVPGGEILPALRG
ncbi:peptide-methionine (R)-S-oxide reductase MsrB [Salicola sp. Rm-C-2C1-2]|uniref:peptide-methionine (R)-S-oxide reductase MsrB n=1 Tax=Salicola sp. Rm-C-2C1-2 TaxID=3141321 RepID=UPI0032E44245